MNNVPEAPLKALPPNRPVRLRNATCAYCGRPFCSELPSTKEHVIGRRFVPLGTLDRQWNLLLRACDRCNGEKADLENDISAITMQPDAYGAFAVDDPIFQKETTRRAANAISRRTRRPVEDSREEVQIGGSELAVTFTAPPQVDAKRLYRLAHLHVQGFFYWITHQPATERGGFPGTFVDVASASRSDWGSPSMRWFMSSVECWHPRIEGTTAHGFFRISIRRHPEGHPVWSWALEWNKSHRVVGFVGDSEAIVPVISSRPSPSGHAYAGTDGAIYRLREEVPLSPEEDILFA
ncbi:HNH endonuclease [Burkholderia seminalis]|uniref:HNH endonuclease n=1 Tax=Burkholderia seminalis TaxID=488731 RepID=UPI001904D317|nr:hypothetical protein [Burkholderia seminalis]MBJ9594140.1 hypothetical protein [Burkholderia seminalis]